MTTQELHEKQIRYFTKPRADYATLWTTDEWGDETKECQYRTPSGKGCAIGCAIPKKVYDPCMEGKSIDALMGIFTGWKTPEASPVLRELFADCDVEYMRESQRMHDDFAGSVPIEHFVYELRKLGAKYGLKEVSA